MRRAVMAGAVFLVAAAPVPGQGVEYATRQLVSDLEELADWCTKKKILRTRNRLYLMILRFEPDHEKARYWLRYEKQGGEWVRPKPYREPRDFRKEALGEFEVRRAAILARFEERLWSIVDRGTPGERHRALGAILTVDPEDERARSRNGEVKLRSRWVLQETATAFKRRAELQRLAGQALRAVPAPREDKPTADEARLGLRWTCAYQGSWWRFVATAPRDEVWRSLLAADATAEFVPAAIPDPARPITPEGMRAHDYGAYYLRDRQEGLFFIRKHASFEAKDRKFAERLGGTWVPGTSRKVLWFDTALGRRDSSCRSGVGAVLRRRYGRFRQGWIIEGFGLYLSWRLVGTRLTILVSPSKYAHEHDYARKLQLWRRMKDPNSDWLRLARQMRASAKEPVDLRFLASKNLNQMTLEDIVHAYSIAAYLIEGRPEGVSQFLASSLESNLDDALAEAYGLTVPELDRRLARWLKESR